MTTPFGPQLIGETEKTLTALLRRFLADTGLSEPQWVTLRVAQLYGADDTEGLAAAVADRAHFPDASDLVGSLTDRGLLEAGRLTPAGRDVISSGAGNERARDRWNLARPPCRRRRGHDTRPQRGPRTRTCARAVTRT